MFQFLLSLPVVFYSSWIFFDGAVRALRNRTLDMMVLVAVAIGTETGMAPLEECALVVSPYSIGGVPAGTIGVLGPTRMDYRLAMATVRGAAQILSDYVEGVYE